MFEDVQPIGNMQAWENTCARSICNNHCFIGTGVIIIEDNEKLLLTDKCTFRELIIFPSHPNGFIFLISANCRIINARSLCHNSLRFDERSLVSCGIPSQKLAAKMQIWLRLRSNRN